MASVALTGRIHERTRPVSKVLLKSLASAGPSIHEVLKQIGRKALAGAPSMWPEQGSHRHSSEGSGSGKPVGPTKQD